MSRFVPVAALAALAVACAAPTAATISVFSSTSDFVAANAPLSVETCDSFTTSQRISPVPDAPSRRARRAFA